MYEDDIHFILSEVLRISKIPIKERLQLPFPENFAMIPHPSGKGHMMCGLAADRRFRQVAETAVARSKEAGRIDVAVVYEKLKFIVVDRFLRQLQELNTSRADRAVQSAIKAAAMAKKDLTHFVPCHLGHAKTPDGFTIGPVVFEQRSTAFERLAPALRAFTDDDHSAASTSDEERRSRRDISEHLLKDTEEYYGTFGWVAHVTVSDCDPKTSRRRATRIVQSALDCLHLLIGTAYSNHMRAGGPRFSTDRRGRIEMDATGQIDISTSVDWQGHNLGPVDKVLCPEA